MHVMYGCGETVAQSAAVAGAAQIMPLCSIVFQVNLLPACRPAGLQWQSHKVSHGRRAATQHLPGKDKITHRAHGQLRQQARRHRGRAAAEEAHRHRQQLRPVAEDRRIGRGQHPHKEGGVIHVSTAACCLPHCRAAINRRREVGLFEAVFTTAAVMLHTNVQARQGRARTGLWTQC